MGTQLDWHASPSATNNCNTQNGGRGVETLPHRSKLKKIAFYGLFGQQNWGNEATLEAIIYNARRFLPDAELSCVCTGPDDTAQRYNIDAFPCSDRYAKGYPAQANRQTNLVMRIVRVLFRRLPREVISWVKGIKLLASCDAMIVPGTGLLTDYSSSPMGIPFRLLKWAIIAKLSGCKLLFVSVGAGPMYHPLTKWLVRAALSLADYRSYRDAYSRRFLEGIGFKTDRDRLYPDLAFSLPRALFSERNVSDHAKLVIGVGVKDYCGKLGLADRGGELKYQAFVAKLATLVTWLLEHEYNVRFLIGDTLYDNKVKEDVIRLLENNGLANGNWDIVNESIRSLQDVLSELAATDIVVSPRYHNVLLALMFNKPAISLSYHKKFEALMDGIGLAPYCQDIDRLDIATLTADILRLQNEATAMRSVIGQRVEEYRIALDEQYRFIFNFQ
jgi:polysaccharide pyruvyl transferase WcaK-like protein